MPLTHWDPVRELMALQERVNRLIDQTLTRTRSQADMSGGGTWSPAVDLYESNKNLILQAELPEVDQADIQLRIHNNRLTLKGERRQKESVSNKQYSRMERAFGPFVRNFTLPTTVDADKVKAEFKKGILKVTMPKRADESSKQIPIS